MSVVEIEWTRQRVLELISLYEAEECLWNVRSSNYKNANVKQDSLQKIAVAFDTSSNFIEKKIRSLHTQYRREKRKIEESKAPGGDPETVYSPTWFGYAAMRFLDDIHELKETRNGKDGEVSLIEGPGPSSTPPPPQKRRKKLFGRPHSFHGASDLLRKQEDKDTDECGAYAKYVALKLRGLEPLQRAVTVNRINQVIFEAELQKYGVESDFSECGRSIEK